MTNAAVQTQDQMTESVDTPGRFKSSEIDEQIRTFAKNDYRRVVATISLWSGSVDEAADAVADALGVVWEQLESGKSIENLAAFVTVVAMNAIRSKHRRDARFRRKAHLLVVDTSDDPTESTATKLDVARVLHRLSHRQRTVIALRYGVDLSVDQIAQELGIAPGTVKATLHQARAALVERVNDEGMKQ